MSRLPLRAVVAALPERPSPQRVEAARRADLQAAFFEREAAEAHGRRQVAIAAAFEQRACGCRSEALCVLVVES
jgi:hypothetical protein